MTAKTNSEVVRVPVNPCEGVVVAGDCREWLRRMPERSVQCVVTSPPYFGLRDYGVEPVVWGGDASCEHEWDSCGKSKQRCRGGKGETLREEGEKAEERWGQGETMLHPSLGAICGSCGAWVGSLGLEPTPDLYVEHLIEVFREVRRVLRDDGVLWLNLGDTYSGYHGNSGKAYEDAPSNKGGYFENQRVSTVGVGGLKQKDLIGIPWLVAFALRDDGWWLRSDVIWAKGVSGQQELTNQVVNAMDEAGCSPGQIEAVLDSLDPYVGNTMPESVRDRCTRGHEHIFMLTKSKRYFYDQDAVREGLAKANDQRTTATFNTAERYGAGNGGNGGLDRLASRMRSGAHGTRNRRDVWTITTKPCTWEYCSGCGTLYEGSERGDIEKDGGDRICPGCGSTDHWVDHFAQFPPDLIGPCVLGGGGQGGCCTECGAPFERAKRKTNQVDASAKGSRFDRGRTARRDGGGRAQKGERFVTVDAGWEPTCECGEWSRELDQEGNQVRYQPPRSRCVVLDPFARAGTTGMVAAASGMGFVGMDVGAEYAAVANARIARCRSD